MTDDYEIILQQDLSIDSIISKLGKGILLTDTEASIYAEHIKAVAEKEISGESKFTKEYESIRLYCLLVVRGNKDSRNLVAVHSKIPSIIASVCEHASD
jgi:hypothetical protein